MIDLAEKRQHLNVLMVNTHINSGGAAKMATTLAHGLMADGQTRVTMHHAGDAKVDEVFVGHGSQSRRKVNALLARFGGSRLVIDGGLARHLTREAHFYDVVHLHNLHGYYLDWVTLLKGLVERPVVWTWHDMWAVTGRCGFSFECDGWTSGCSTCKRRHYYPAAWLDFASKEFEEKTEFFSRLTHMVVVTPSDWLKDLAIRRGIPPDQIRVIPNPVDAGNFKPREVVGLRRHHGLSPDERVALFVAADCENPLKGYRDFKIIVGLLKWRAIVVGKNSGRLPDGFISVGDITDPAGLADYYSMADVLVVPSLFDNYPNTAIESLSCGTPVFGYDTGGIRSQVHPQYGGTVKAGATAELAKLMAKTLPSGKTSEIAEALARHSRGKWATDGIAGKYRETYRSAIDRVLKARRGR